MKRNILIKFQKISKVIKYFKIIKKFTIISCLLIIIIFLNNYKKIEIDKKISLIKYKKSKIKICIYTLGKKENRYIREFVEYYQKLGIDQIFLYDNNDEDGERFEDVINDFIKNGFVKLFNWRGKKKKQITILNDCYLNNYKKFDWLIFFDIDEYIHLKDFSNIKDFLINKKFNKCEIIYLNWIIHTDNNLIHYDNRSLYERFPILEPNAQKKNKTYYSPVKSILKGNISNIKIKCLHKLTSGLKTCNGFGKKPKLKLYLMIPDFKYYYIDHFYFKSLDEFAEKLNRGSAKTHNNTTIKLFKLKRFFTMNEINIEKLNYIKNKTGINIKKYKGYLLGSKFNYKD